MVPGESCVSYIVEGMIEYLMSCSDDLSQLIKQKTWKQSFNKVRKETLVS